MEKIAFNLALAQYPIHFYKSENEWQKNVELWLKSAADKNCNFVVFPEYGSMELVSLIKHNENLNLIQQLEKLQELHNDFLDLYVSLAKKLSIYIVTPSFPLKLGEKFFNRAYLVSPKGHFDFQDKIHMTRFEDDWGISPGETELKVFDTSLGKVGIQICFDIEFSWASSILAINEVDLILAPSCTEGFHGLNRVHIGSRARALENQLYVGVSQVVGDAPWSHAVDKNTGFSALYGPVDVDFPDDGIIGKGSLNKPDWLINQLHISKLENVRENGQVLNFKKNSDYQWITNNKRLKIKKIDLKT